MTNEEDDHLQNIDSRLDKLEEILGSLKSEVDTLKLFEKDENIRELLQEIARKKEQEERARG